MLKLKGYFTKAELTLWGLSVLLILTGFVCFDRVNYLTLIASLIGATSLIFIAKGNPVGQALTVVFSCLYGYISYEWQYYGEMITYLAMTAPMAIVALVSWIRHPYNGNRSEVAVSNLKSKDIVVMCAVTVAVTVVFYFILDALNTASLVVSTVSVTTSFLAVYLTAKRSPFYALAYACNDIVLIVLWVIATFKDVSNISVVLCFVMFFANDIYGFVNWNRMKNRQSKCSSEVVSAE